MKNYNFAKYNINHYTQLIMKNFYFIAVIALLSFTSCKKTEVVTDETNNDSISMQDTTKLNNETIKDSTLVDSTTVDSSNVKLLDNMSTKTTTKDIDETKGKFALAETKWKLVELNGKAVKNSTNKDYFINLDSKSGKFKAYAGCNTISGSFIMKAATKLSFTNVMSTKMACPNSDVESKFTKALSKVNNYMIEGTMLHFHNGKNAVAKFEEIK